MEIDFPTTDEFSMWMFYDLRKRKIVGPIAKQSILEQYECIIEAAAQWEKYRRCLSEEVGRRLHSNEIGIRYAQHP